MSRSWHRWACECWRYASALCIDRALGHALKADDFEAVREMARALEAEASRRSPKVNNNS